jgi:hypothetical protein
METRLTRGLKCDSGNLATCFGLITSHYQATKIRTDAAITILYCI